MFKGFKERLTCSNLDKLELNRLFKYREKILNSKSKLLKFIYLRKYNILLKKNNAIIPLSTKLGKNIVFPHGINGILLSSGTIIGDNCTIFHQVTIGSNTLIDSKRKGSPIIGNNVYIGAGAKIIGKVFVGDNVRIGANTVVTNDIPSNTTVVSEKNRIIKHDSIKDNSYYEYSNIFSNNRKS